MSNYYKSAQHLLAQAGIEINGKQPWDITVHDERLYKRVFSSGTLGLGEAYMDGWWDSVSLDQFFTKVVSSGIQKKIGLNIPTIAALARAKFFNLQKISRAFQIGQKHYDVGNDLYKAMLDKSMTYTCGYWKNAANLDEAQVAKLDLVCKKIGLKKNDRILDIGCGWGSFLKYATEKYDCSAVGITVSGQQAELARQKCESLPVKILLKDYREIHEKFSHIVSLGMFEHVGFKNYKTYMSVASNNLKDDGLFLLHTIGSNRSGKGLDPWIEKYIFPNSMLPSLKQIAQASEKKFIIEDVHNFGAYYDKTLMSWHKNFENEWEYLKQKYSEEFHRMWRYYLLSCAAMFRTRSIQLWQIVLSKKGVPGGYNSFR